MKNSSFIAMVFIAGLIVVGLEIRNAMHDPVGRTETQLVRLENYEHELTNIMAYAFSGTNSEDTVRHLKMAISQMTVLQNAYDEYDRTNNRP